MEAVKLIDDDMKTLDSIKFSMLSRRNTFAPVSRLPPEILARIFSFFQVVEPPSRGDIGWIVITHVCRHWRQVAEEDATLWANIACVLGSRWNCEMLHRAKEVPLIIYDDQFLFVNQDGRCSTSSFISSHLYRTRVICLQSIKHRSFIHLLPSLNRAAPILERIEMHTRPSTSCYQVPDDFLAHNAPRLHTAVFDGFNVPLSSPAFRDVAVLSLGLTECSEATLESLPTSEAFFHSLAGMRNLKTLSIAYYSPHDLSGSPSIRARPPPTDLSSLCDLSLIGRAEDCAAVMQQIRFPLTASVTLNCRSDDINNDFGALISALERHGRDSGRAAPLLTLSVEMSEKCAISFRAWRVPTQINVIASKPRSVPSDEILGQPAVTLKLVGRTYIKDWNLRMFQEISSSFPVDEVRSLRVDTADHYADPSTWFQAFGLVWNVEEVSLFDSAVPHFCSMLYHAPHSRTHSIHTAIPVQDVLFPKLKTMYFSRGHSITTLRQILPQILHEHRTLGVPLDIIDI